MFGRDARLAIALRRSTNRAARQVADAAVRPQRLIEVAGLVAVGLTGFLVLVALDWVVRNGLWGEFAFAMIGCSLAVWGLGRFVKARLPKHFHFIAPRWWQAPFWAALPLLGVPFALLTLWWGPVVLLLVLLALLGLFAVLPWSPPVRVQPIQWLAALAAVVAVGLFAWTDTGTDKGQAAAATPPVPGAMALALRYRPLLYFDSQESFFPLNVTAAMKEGRVDECRYVVQNSNSNCKDVNTPADLDSSYDYLSIKGGSAGLPADTGGRGSTYYVHVVRNGPNVYLDFWVYYAQNPLPVAKQILCGPGLRAPELTCFEHPADWEGLVVVLGPCKTNVNVNSPCHNTPAGALRIIAVNYAQHRGVVHIAWNTLLAHWAPRGLAVTGDERPLAYIALDSHASYPLPCSAGCGLESHYNGRLPWGNNGAQCGTTCLEALPTNSDGSPASWNDFPGHWGKQSCIWLGSYCDVGPAPRAPAFQTRYKQPWNAK